MISRPIALARAMSEPTSRPSHPSAHCAELVRRGSTAKRRAPFRTAVRTWWKKMGCVSRAFDPQRMTRSVSSTSRYELVPPPAPNTVARPTTLGACQVRLQESTLLLPMTDRANFCARKFISFVAFEQEKRPKASVARGPATFRKPCGRAVEGLVPGGGNEGAVLLDPGVGETGIPILLHGASFTSRLQGTTPPRRWCRRR